MQLFITHYNWVLSLLPVDVRTESIINEVETVATSLPIHLSVDWVICHMVTCGMVRCQCERYFRMSISTLNVCQSCYLVNKSSSFLMITEINFFPDIESWDWHSKRRNNFTISDLILIFVSRIIDTSHHYN